MSLSTIQPRLARIHLHPIKSLDPVAVAEARIGPNGGLANDRVWALFAADGRWVNGKRTAAIHFIRATYAPDLSTVTLAVPGDRRHLTTATLAFPADTGPASEWFSTYFEQPVHVRYAREGFPDDGLAAGPTIVSTASLQAVSDWFLGVSLEQARLRFRTTLELDSVAPTTDFVAGQAAVNSHQLPAFWEDQLFAENDRNVVRFRIGEVAFEGSNPCARCPVPPRDAHTGVNMPTFQKRFSELRRAHLPPWSPAARFDHFYRLATNTRVPSTEYGKSLHVGDKLLL